MSLDLSETEPYDAPDSRPIESGIKIAARAANCYYFGRVSTPMFLETERETESTASGA